MIFQTKFSRLICGDPSVRAAYAHAPLFAHWWRVVLWLHGKSASPLLDAEKRRQCVADGFRFYASLYRTLAGVFLCTALLLFVGLPMLGDKPPLYGCLAFLMAACYLALASEAASRGAADYQAARPAGTLLLVTFLVMVIIFLAMFLASVSVLLRADPILPAWANLALVAALLALGIGSYMIELAFLIVEQSEV